MTSPNNRYASADKIESILEQNQNIEEKLQKQNQNGLHYLTRRPLNSY